MSGRFARGTTMPPISGHLRSFRTVRIPLWTGLGSCLYCTRGAFRAAVVAWSIAIVAQGIGAYQRLPVVIGTAACALTALWLAHLFAHGLKAYRRGEVAPGQPGVSRRAAVRAFMSATASAAIVTSIPRLALAQCGDETTARCHSTELECHAGCDRSFHRDERNHACHQECSSNSVACKADAGCD